MFDGEDGRHGYTQQSSNPLKLKISFPNSVDASSSQTMQHSISSKNKCRNDQDYLVEVTSRHLYIVLSEIHQLLVRRDPRGIFARPVTDDIAVDYSKTISQPMDLGTIFVRLQSRTHYASAADYLFDVTLMCNNAMTYNAPDTIYYQRARKLLAFCRKQLVPNSIRKLCSQLGIRNGLTSSEIGLDEAAQPDARMRSPEHVRTSARLSSPTPVGSRAPCRDFSSPHSSAASPSPSSTSVKNPSRRRRCSSSSSGQGFSMAHSTCEADEIPQSSKMDQAMDELENRDDCRASPEAVSLVKPVPPPSDQVRRPRGRPRKSKCSIPVTKKSRVSPLPVPLLHSSSVTAPSPTTSNSESSFGPTLMTNCNPSTSLQFDIVSDPLLSQTPAIVSLSRIHHSPLSSSKYSDQSEQESTISSPKRKSDDRDDSAPSSKRPCPKAVASTRKVMSKRSRRKKERSPSPVNEVLLQSRQAAARVAADLKAKYCGNQVDNGSLEGSNQLIGPRIVLINHEIPGCLTATESVQARSRLASEGVSGGTDSYIAWRDRPVLYPSVYINALTGASIKSDTLAGPIKPSEVELMDPLTPHETEVFANLNRLQTGQGESLASGVHGPLAIFSPSQLATMTGAYGSDPACVEYALSLLNFVNPMGRWARRWATKRLDLATDGAHSHSLASNKTVPPAEEGLACENQPTKWTDAANLTVDSPTPPPSPDLGADESGNFSFLRSLGHFGDSTLISTVSSSSELKSSSLGEAGLNRTTSSDSTLDQLVPEPESDNRAENSPKHAEAAPSSDHPPGKDLFTVTGELKPCSTIKSDDPSYSSSAEAKLRSELHPCDDQSLEQNAQDAGIVELQPCTTSGWNDHMSDPSVMSTETQNGSACVLQSSEQSSRCTTSGEALPSNVTESMGLTSTSSTVVADIQLELSPCVDHLSKDNDYSTFAQELGQPDIAHTEAPLSDSSLIGVAAPTGSSPLVEHSPEQCDQSTIVESSQPHIESIKLDYHICGSDTEGITELNKSSSCSDNPLESGSLSVLEDQPQPCTLASSDHAVNPSCSMDADLRNESPSASDFSPIEKSNRVGLGDSQPCVATEPNEVIHDCSRSTDARTNSPSRSGHSYNCFTDVERLELSDMAGSGIPHDSAHFSTKSTDQAEFAIYNSPVSSLAPIDELQVKVSDAGCNPKDCEISKPLEVSELLLDDQVPNAPGVMDPEKVPSNLTNSSGVCELYTQVESLGSDDFEQNLKPTIHQVDTTVLRVAHCLKQIILTPDREYTTHSAPTDSQIFDGHLGTNSVVDSPESDPEQAVALSPTYHSSPPDNRVSP